MKRVLTIAGSDPTGGAGIQRDLATFQAFGVHGMTAITSITVQDEFGLHARHDVDPELVRAQMRAAFVAGVDAVKTGMLATADIVHAVAEMLSELPDVPLVVDPVMFASAGGRLLDEEGVELLKAELLPIATVITPNLEEATALTGIAVKDEQGQALASRALKALGARAAVVTGGHLAGDPVDILCDADGIDRISGFRIEGPALHGTGCRYSAALAALLAQGTPMREAAGQAKDFVREQMGSLGVP